ncbi:3355_t:CDS:10 [Entrophospora sp. SA101]|nr:15558_t:CDS:10 [Entrophospora sp. SA101]CAJ0766120.1 3355_t:CDS:10 [Entrophospora sp. SA101]
MDSYPPEFILPHVPLMMVMGLNREKDSSSEQSNSSNNPPAPVNPKSGGSGLQRNSSSSNTLPGLTTNQISQTLISLFMNKAQASVWDLGKNSNTTFNVTFVDKNFQFPPRKPLKPPSTPHHSSLSPHTPGSPVHPDGLIPQLWVRRHREILPCVVVGFYDLCKQDEGQLGFNENPEKERDHALAIEINEKRKSLIDRGIKFAAVIVIKTPFERLNYIRKVSGLYVRNCFFVLYPSSYDELQNFVINLQKSLYEHGLNYYREHSKRIKRKRATSSFSISSPGYNQQQLIDYPLSAPTPLGTQGWMIRYDYKLAVFAEFRQELDAALNYYESAYNLLTDLFSPESVISPGAPGLTIRSKRWEEARILTDCINVKICKISILMDSPLGALAQLNKHVKTFKQICNKLGIGEDDTFEYWSWLSKQYRVFGEIIEVATRSGFIIQDASKLSHSISAPSLSADYRYSLSSNNNPNFGVNPTMVLQHPGFYYYLAAKYNSIKRQKFLDIEKSIHEGIDVVAKIPDSILEAERMLDHSGFFERIAKTYRKEGWHTILESILQLSLRCAKVLEFIMDEQKRTEIQNELTNIIFRNEIENLGNIKPVILNMNETITCHVQFKQSMAFVGEPTLFQVTITTSPDSPPLPLRFSFIRFTFSDAHFNHYLKDKSHDDEEIDDSKIQLIDCKDCSWEEVEGGEGYAWVKDVKLIFQKGVTRVFEGIITPKESGESHLQVVTLGILNTKWRIELRFDLSGQRETQSRRKWLIKTATVPTFKNIKEQNILKVTKKPPKLEIKANFSNPVLLDEYYPIELVVTNLESEDVKAFMNIDIINDLKDIDLDIIPAGQSCVKTIYIIGKKTINFRTLHLVVKWIEKKEEIKVSFIEPFTVSYSIVPQIEEIKHEKDATNSENSPVVIKRIDRHLLTAKITSNGPWDLLVTGIDLVLLGQANSQAKIEIIESKNNELEDQIWKTGHKHQVNYLLELTILDYISNDYNIDVGLLDIQWKRKELIKNIFIPYTETTMMTPQIIIPKTDLTAILTIPKKSIVGKIFTLTLKLINWTNTQIKIDVMVEVNDTFVFSGYKQTYFNVSPLGSYLFKVNCFPLVPGKTKLPKIKMIKNKVVDDNNAHDDDENDNNGNNKEIHIMAPGYKEISEDEWFFIFIKPKTKI